MVFFESKSVLRRLSETENTVKESGKSQIQNGKK